MVYVIRCASPFNLTPRLEIHFCRREFGGKLFFSFSHIVVSGPTPPTFTYSFFFIRSFGLHPNYNRISSCSVVRTHRSPSSRSDRKRVKARRCRCRTYPILARGFGALSHSQFRDTPSRRRSTIQRQQRVVTTLGRLQRISSG